MKNKGWGLYSKTSCTILNLLFTTILVYAVSNAYSQDTIPNTPISTCNQYYPDSIISLIREDFKSLEQYFITYGLLEDNTGASYYQVYQRIVQDDELNFVSDAQYESLNLLDSLLFHRCSFLLFTKQEMSQVKQHHLEANTIITYYPGEDVTPTFMANRILYNLQPEDFNITFYKLLSLQIFYKLAIPYTNQDKLGYPLKKEFKENNILVVKLDEADVISIDKEIYDIKSIKSELVNYIKELPKERAIKVLVDNKSSYASFLKLCEVIDESYNELRNDYAKSYFGSSYQKLAKQDKFIIKAEVPFNVISTADDSKVIYHGR
jgi:hypothetical protein